MVLLASASLTVRTFLVLQNTDPGHQSRSRARDRRAAAAGEVRHAREAQSLHRRAGRARRRRCPASRRWRSDCRSVATQSPYAIAGQTARTTRSGSASTWRPPITCGRSASRCAADGCSTPPKVRRGDRVAVINEAAAKLWPAGENPIGSRLRLGMLERRPGANVRRHRAPARGHHRRRRRQHPERRPARRAGAGGHDSLHDRRDAEPHARGAHGRRSQPAAQPGARRGARDGPRAAARPADHAGRDPRPGSRAAALHDGAVQRVRGARPRARGGRASTACCRST